MDNLQSLAQHYLRFLIERDEQIIKSFLSLNFLERKYITKQIKLIKNLPQLLYGFGPEVNLWSKYTTQKSDGQLIISPFQFDVFYTHHTNMVDTEKTTITIHQLKLENDFWVIGSILCEEDQLVLESMAKDNVKIKK